VIQLFRDSECALAKFVLERPLISGDELLNILCHTPNLRALEIHSGDPDVLDNHFFDALIIGNALLTDVIPWLTHLRVAGAYTFDANFLLAMLESRTTARAAAAGRLSKVAIMLDDRAFTADRVRWFGGLRDIAVTVIDRSGIVKM
jgi:hypothetical protein